jgi:N-acetylglucosaminyl-diphospho-decaprenol L-rhamnosyltransferase
VLQGASFLLRRSVLDQVGFLDGDYFMYSEEVDLCRRIQQAGWGLYWVPQSQVIHYGGQSTQQIAADMFLQLYLGKLKYFRKHHGRLAGALYKFILLQAALARLALTPLLWLQPPPQRQEQLTLARHYQRLVATLPRM